MIGDRKIDYLVINHMEPDHSGSIALIKKYYPEIQIVGNKKTFQMMEGFYGIADNTVEVKNGGVLALGGNFYPNSYNGAKETVTFDDFAKLDIRVATVLECERVPKMKKLLKFKLDDGTPKGRTIVSGIAQWYEPEQLVGKQVLFIANLAPREFKNGLVSEGMILSAENYDGSISVTTVEKTVKGGSMVC